MRRFRFGVVVLTLSVVGLVVFVVTRSGRDAKNPPSIPPSRIPHLKALVEQQQKESATAVASYIPNKKGRFDDLDAPVADILRGLPGALQVEVPVRSDQPTHRIIHLRDWHFVPRELYALDLRSTAGRQLSDEEVDARHQELLLEVEAVQLEQMALLRCLIRHHGLRRVFCEGLTPKDMPNYREQIAVLKNMEQSQIPKLRKQLEEVRELLRGMVSASRTTAQGYDKAKGIEREITGLLDQHRLRLLEVGAVGRLLIAGELEEVLPLDDAEMLDRAKPVTPDGKVKFDQEKVTARHDGQVKAVLDHGPVGLIVLGAAHDLSDSVRRLGDGRCEYVRVTTRRCREFMGEEDR